MRVGKSKYVKIGNERYEKASIIKYRPKRGSGKYGIAIFYRYASEPASSEVFFDNEEARDIELKRLDRVFGV